MKELESDKDWMISRWLDMTEARVRQVQPEVHTSVSKTYQTAYIAAINDMRDFFKKMGYYRK